MKTILERKRVRTLQVPRLPNITKKEVKEALKGIRLKTFRSLVHVGRLDNPTQINGDFEGPLLSTSQHPHEWVQIAKLGGLPHWKIQGNITTVDFHRTKMTRIRDWALARGLVRKETWWKCPAGTNEEGETQYFLCKSLDEAKKEKDPENEEEPTPQNILVARAKLQEFWRQRKKSKDVANPWHTDAMILALLIELAAQNEWGNDEFPKGVFWNDVLDPWGLSAPRIALSPTEIKRNKKIEIFTIKTK